MFIYAYSVYHKERAKMWRRPIVPLTDDERDNHLFRIPDDPKRFPVLPELSQSLDGRSATQPQITKSSENIPKTESPVSKVPAHMTDSSSNLKTSGALTTQESAVKTMTTPPRVLQLVN